MFLKDPPDKSITRTLQLKPFLEILLLDLRRSTLTKEVVKSL